MEYLIYFYVYSLLGWLLETIYASIRRHRYCSKQTLLKSPLCPIYGIGAVLMLWLLSPVQDSYALVFAGGFFIASSVEYLVSAYYLRRFHIRRWSYAKCFGNLDGHVTISYSILWGFFAICLLFWLHPAIRALLCRLDFRLLSMGAYLVSIWVIRDYQSTLRELDRYAKGEENCILTKFLYVTKP